jgi:hypothetical protein
MFCQVPVVVDADGLQGSQNARDEIGQICLGVGDIKVETRNLWVERSGSPDAGEAFIKVERRDGSIIRDENDGISRLKARFSDGVSRLVDVVLECSIMGGI